MNNLEQKALIRTFKDKQGGNFDKYEIQNRLRINGRVYISLDSVIEQLNTYEDFGLYQIFLEDERKNQIREEFEKL